MIPKIFSVTPTEALPSGHCRMTISGYGFRLPSEAAPADVPGTVRETVRVKIGPEYAPAVLVFDRFTLVALVPAYTGGHSNLPALVDVQVENLDDTGAPIPGEVVVRSGCFTFSRQSLITESPLTWFTRQVIEDLKTNVIANVEIAALADWSRDPSSGLVAVSELPALILDGPTIEESVRYREQVEEPRHATNEDGSVDVNAPPLCFDVTFGIILVGRKKPEVLSLQSTVVRLFARCPYLEILNEPGGDRIRFRRSLTQWRSADRPAEQVFSAESEFKIEGVEIDDSYGTAADGVPIDDIQTELTEDTDSSFVVTVSEEP